MNCMLNGQPVQCPDFLAHPNPTFVVIFIVAQLVALAVGIVVAIAVWKIFVKAGEPGWACLIPIYNITVVLKMVKKPLWWIFLMFIPLVNIIIAIMVCLELAKAFGKSSGFGVGLALLSFIFFPILGFGDSKYIYAKVNA